MMEEVAQRGRELFDSGFYCAESVLLAVAEAKGIQSGLVPRIATGFCSGVARTCGQCGAVSGAILALGMVKGRTSPDQPVDETYATVRELLRRFEDRFGSTNCKQLIGCDLSTPEGRETFESQDLVEQCREYTGEAARITMLLLEEASGK